MRTEIAIGAATLGMSPTELHGISKKSDSIKLSNQVTASGERQLDANIWLPRAAEAYHISPNLNDYVLVPVPSIISDIPNTNGDSASREELLRFHPDLGQLAFETFKRKPTHLEHDNTDITKAKGVIFDVFLRPLTGFAGNHVKVVKLCGFDRTKDPELVREILSGEINTYSMGFRFQSYSCSVCGTEYGQNFGKMCAHTRPRKPTWRSLDNKLVYRQCKNIRGFELSAVRNPAYVSALSDHLMHNFG